MPEFSIELHGSKANDAQAVSEILSAVDGLFRAVSKEMTGTEVGLVLAGVGFKCDGCGRKVKSLPRSWTKDGPDDLCPKCQRERKSGL